MEGRRAAKISHLQTALRFERGQPMIYSTFAEKFFVQTNDSLEVPVFEEIQGDLIDDYLSYEDWEPLDGLSPN